MMFIPQKQEKLLVFTVKIYRFFQLLAGFLQQDMVVIVCALILLMFAATFIPDIRKSTRERELAASKEKEEKIDALVKSEVEKLKNNLNSTSPEERKE